MGYFDSILSVEFNMSCKWLPANQFLFQMANIFLVLTYFVKPINAWGLIQLRFSLTMAGLCFGVWGGLVICSLDCMLWNLCFAVGNSAHLVYLLLKIRPKKFSADHELLYANIFKPLGVERFQYSKFSQLSQKRFVQVGEYYTKDGLTEKNHIGLVASGSFEVYLGSVVISHVDSMEFLNSPEWIATGNSPTTTYQVSMKATTNSQVFEWDRESLLQLFKNEVVLKNVFDSLIGKDVCKKLFDVHRQMLTYDGSEIRKDNTVLHDAPLLAYSTANHFENHFIPSTDGSIHVHLNRSKTNIVTDQVKELKKSLDDFSVTFSKNVEKSEEENLLSEKIYDFQSHYEPFEPCEMNSLFDEETQI